MVNLNDLSGHGVEKLENLVEILSRVVYKHHFLLMQVKQNYIKTNFGKITELFNFSGWIRQKNRATNSYFFILISLHLKI